MNLFKLTLILVEFLASLSGSWLVMLLLSIAELLTYLDLTEAPSNLMEVRKLAAC